MNWEGIENPNLNFFRLKDYDIPYSYSPLIVASEKLINGSKSEINDFLKATKQGYIYSMNNIQESTGILYNYLPNSDKRINIIESLKFSIPYFGNSKSFGKISKDVFQKFFKWLELNEIENRLINVDEIYLQYDF